MANRTEADKNLASIASTNTSSLNPVVTHINDTVKHTGPFYAITALEGATSIDVDQCDTGIKESDGSGAMQNITTDFTIPQGVTIYGNFNSIELEGGSVIAYSVSGTVVTVES
tara:strand:- start:169 stop:507 length:339 start_codon:yes stop_codon:yes gene_type:complete